MASLTYFSKKRIYQAHFEVLLDKENHTHLGSSSFLPQIFDSNFATSILNIWEFLYFLST